MTFRRSFIKTICCIFILAGCASKMNQLSLMNDNDEKEASPFQHGKFIQRGQQGSDIDLGVHARNILSEMTGNMSAAKSEGIIAVTHFANASSDYSTTDELGHALGEAFLRELHQFGFKTLDYKVADAIRVTMDGDFALSRDFMELKNEVPAEYVLVGTITEQHQGFVVNARVVELSSKVILATGNSFIPRSSVNMLVTQSPVNARN